MACSALNDSGQFLKSWAPDLSGTDLLTEKEDWVRISADGLYRLDTEKFSEPLIPVEEIAGVSEQPLTERDGRTCVAIPLDNGSVSLHFSPPPTNDCRRYDMFAVSLICENVAVAPSLRIVLSSQTPGISGPDSASSGRSFPIAFETWGEYLFPFENFLLTGCCELFHPVARLTLTLAPENASEDESSPKVIYLSYLRGCGRDRAEGPRLTDAGLAAALSLEKNTHTDVIAHFRERTTPRDLYSDALPDPPGLGRPGTEEEICNNVILGFDVGEPVDWRANPNGDRAWMHHFNRHLYFRTLLTAWKHSSDLRYVRKLDELWLSWIRANPEAVGHNGGGDPAWETLSVAVRIYGSWIWCWFQLLHEPAFRDSTRIEILKSLHGHAEHLLQYEGYANNWLVVESRALYMLGVLFPEFRRAATWRETGLRRLTRELGEQIYSDGADRELSCTYHIMAVEGFLEPVELARLNELDLPFSFQDILPKTFDYVGGMTRPDGSLPAVNDSGGYLGKEQERRDFLRKGESLCGVSQTLDVPGGKYAGRSRCFPEAGFFILASGEDRNGLWALFDAGNPGSNHRHADALNVEFYACGSPFIVDPGISSYQGNPWTAYYRSTYSHNAILINPQTSELFE